MKQKNYFITSLINALGVLVYTSAIAWFLYNGEKIFGRASSFLMPLFLLLLFMISALITGYLVLGQPILLYLNNQKNDALKLFLATCLWLIIFAVLIVMVLIWR